MRDSSGTSSASGGGENFPALTRLANRFLLAAAAFALALSLLNARLEMLDGQSPLRSRICWAGMLLAVALAGARFVLGARVRRTLLMAFVAWSLLELLLQAAAWTGVLPGVNTKKRYAWARVYWTGEGRGNSIRNRHGWYFPEFDLAKTNRLALIGDSFVEGVEVHRSRNMGVVLGEKIRASHPDVAVLSLGDHGTGPADYFEVLKYAQRQFQIRDAVVCIYLGNDITDCSPRLQFHDPKTFLYYGLDAAGALTLSPEAERFRATRAMRLDAQHRSPLLILPRLLSSHCMTVQVPLSIRDGIVRRRRAQQAAVLDPGPDAELARLGLKGAAFAVNPPPEAREGMQIVQALLQRMAAFSAENSIRLRLVTIPFFPPDFYGQLDGTNWTARFGDYDFLGPERELKAFAARLGVSLLPLGDRMRERGLKTGDIRTLYHSNGSGHFSEAGHRFIAEAMAAEFFPAPAGR
ncbi:MAG: hypothetical protein HY301_02680 [Verrucomicrobia bacterium]|nr:hypothetical protein [Verrucomicrobiota bacterium]